MESARSAEGAAAKFYVTLSFDNGPSLEATPGVLDVLEKEGIKSSFWVLGRNIVDPEVRRLSERAKEAGHWIGNHSYTHSIPLGVAELVVDGETVTEREIIKTEKLIGDLAEDPKLFRPFGGGGKLGKHLLSSHVLEYLKSEAYTVVLWNSIPRDWVDADGWVETCIRQCQEQPSGWSLVVVHDLPTGAMANLQTFIKRVRDLGGVFRQDFPKDCTPLEAGKELTSMKPFVTATP